MTAPATDRPQSEASPAASPGRRGGPVAVRAVGRAAGGAALAVVAVLPLQALGPSPGQPWPAGIGGALAGLQVLFAGACLLGDLAARPWARVARVAAAGLLTPGLCLTGFVFFEVLGGQGPAGIVDGTALALALDMLARYPTAIVLTSITFGAGFPLAHATWPDGSEPREWTLPRKLVWIGNAGVTAGLALYVCCAVGGVPAAGPPFILAATGGAVGFALGDAAAARAAAALGEAADEGSGS